MGPPSRRRTGRIRRLINFKFGSFEGSNSWVDFNLFFIPQLEFRGTLVQQLRDVTKKLGLTLGTLHSAVAQLDLFMDAHRLRADRLTHVALACLSLAGNFYYRLLGLESIHIQP